MNDMPFPRYATLNPHDITVARSERQRRDITTDLDSLRNSIATHGQLQPIIVRREDLTLCAGERRLQSCKDLGIPVEVRFYDTLDPVEAQIIELEENLRREELPWRDLVTAIANIHKLYLGRDPSWTQHQTAEQLGIERPTITKILQVHASIHLPALANCNGYVSAWEILVKLDNRKLDNLVADIAEAGSSIFTDGPIIAPAEPGKPTPPKRPESILCEDFTKWAHSYNGPKFNFIHCDFPYGIDVFAGPQTTGDSLGTYEDTPDIYWSLLATMCDNLDNLLAFAGHIMFWFSMNHYTDTISFIKQHAPILTINPIPLVWMKSDNAGVCPDPLRRPRQITETALLLTRGDRNLVKVVANAYAAPTDRKLHPSCKPEPMLRHFFGALVDGTTRMLDPTCGSGAALRAAESLGAESVMGLEIDETHAQNAKDALRKFRALRAL